MQHCLLAEFWATSVIESYFFWCHIPRQYFVPPEQTAIFKQTVMKVTVTRTDITLSFIWATASRESVSVSVEGSRELKEVKIY